jgi:hypothetical protein
MARITVVVATKIMTALVDHLTHRRHILQSGNDRFRYRESTAAKAANKEVGIQSLTPN